MMRIARPSATSACGLKLLVFFCVDAGISGEALLRGQCAGKASVNVCVSVCGVVCMHEHLPECLWVRVCS